MSTHLVQKKVFVFFIALILVNESGQKDGFGGFKEITGTMQNFEVLHETQGLNYIPTKDNTKRYDGKLIDYKDHIQNRRDDSFLR